MKKKCLIGRNILTATLTTWGLAAFLAIPGFLFGAISDFIYPGASLSRADYSFIGEKSSDGSGYRIVGAGDVDNDGLDDILIGAPYGGSSWNGRTYLIMGSSLGSTSVIDLSTADYTFTGDSGGDQSGRSVAGGEDVDGNGQDDILIGASGDSYSGSCSGKTFLFLGESLGSTTSLTLSDADYVFGGENSSDASGLSVSLIGDVDGNGKADILIGAPENDDGGSNAGKTYLILGESLGSTTTIALADADYAFIGENSNDKSGTSVSSAGDVDGDGLDDILIGAFQNDDGGSNAGKSYLFLGSTLAGYSTPVDISLSDADCSFTGEAVDDYSSLPVASAGDVDGDGLSDIIIGTKENDDGGSGAGKVYLIPGSSIGSGGITYDLATFTGDWEFIGESAGSELGYKTGAAGAGDVDGDGLDDILIGADNHSGTLPFDGKSYLFLAKNLPAAGSIIYTGTDEDCAFTGETGYDYSGFSVAGGGDVNGDGLADLLISSWGNDDGGSGAGKTYLVLSERGFFPGSAIYVDSILGTSSGPGGFDYPFDTITGGITAAASDSIETVIVRGGYYDETVTLESDIDVIGRKRDISGVFMPPTIESSSVPSSWYLVEAPSGISNASFSGFALYMFGIQLDGCNDVSIKNNWVYGYKYSNPLLMLTGGASDNFIRNNIFAYLADGASTVLKVEANSDDNQIVNNTLHLFDVDGTCDLYGIYLDNNTDDNVIRNNILEVNPYPTSTYTGYGFYAAGSSVTADIQYNKTPADNYDGTGMGLIGSTNIVAAIRAGFVNTTLGGQS